MSHEPYLRNLQSRRLVQWSLGYLGAAWLILQILDVVAEPWGISGGFLRVAQIVLLAGLIITIVYAWFRGEPDRRPIRRREVVAVKAAAIGSVGLLIALIGLSSRGSLVPNAGEADRSSLVVLPFDNLSDDPGSEYFTDGIADELRNALARLDNLRVVGRASSFAFKDVSVDAREIGAELGVESVLEGSVRRSSGRLRVTAQLTETAEGFHLWSNVFERELRDASDIFDVQEEISDAIVEQLRLELGTSTPEVVSRPTTDLEAYNAYLRGRHFWRTRLEPSLRLAEQEFEAAIGRDPAFAEAYVGLADVYAVLGVFFDAGSDMAPKAKAAAQQALDIDPSLSDAHASLAFVASQLEQDWDTALTLFAEAIRLDPSNAQAYQWHANALRQIGRYQEAVEAGSKAIDLDPLSAPAIQDLAWTHWYARSFSQSIPWFQRSLEIDPRFAPSHARLGMALERLGRYPEAVRSVEEAVSLTDNAPYMQAVKGRILVSAGDTSAAMAIAQELEDVARTAYVEPTYMAALYVGLGQPDQAFQWLEQSLQLRPSSIGTIGTHAWFDQVRTDPRFQVLLNELSLSQFFPAGRVQ